MCLRTEATVCSSDLQNSAQPIRNDGQFKGVASAVLGKLKYPIRQDLIISERGAL